MLHADVLGERARLTPEKTALVCVPQGCRHSYGELSTRAERLVRVWREACGLMPGDRVALLAHNRVEFIDAFFAAARSGLILVPLNTRLTPHEIEFIVRDAAPRAFVYDGAFADAVRALSGRFGIEHWLALDRPAVEGHARLADLLERQSPAASASHPAHAPRPAPEDVCCLLYTSGTTGKPKGVMLPHRMIAWNAYNTAISWQLRDDDVSPVFTPLYHAGGLGVFLLPLFAIGGTVVLHAGFDTEEILATVERERCSIVFGVPTIFKLLMESPSFARVELSHVRWLISGGAPLPSYIIEGYQRRGLAFKQGYGLTEVGVNCFSMSVEESVRKKGSIGKPMLFTEARAVAENGTDAEDNEVGELWLRGPHVCKGYWNNAEATAAALDADGWFHTGDLARRDEEGFFYIAGRQKDMLISGGVNVYPAEIEAELLQHPAVQDAAVVGVTDPTWGETAVGCVVLRHPGSVSSDDLAAFLAERLAKYKIPRRFLFLDALPRTPYGKVLKNQLRERLGT